MNIKQVILVISGILIFNNTINAQKVNQRLTNDKNGEEILIGKCTRQAFYEKPFSDWYVNEYNLYRNLCDKSTIDSLSKYIKNFRIEIVMATWCSDSREHFPHFMVVSDLCNFPDSSLTIICVDREKLAPSISVAEKKVEFVPTFIIYYQEKEIGRIIETPSESIEKHLLKIIRSK